MLQRDYFMKMTQMLVSVLAKVLFHKENKNYEDAQKEIEAAAKTIVGIDIKLISMLHEEDMVKLMKTSDIYAGRCLIAAELLKEYGDTFIEQGKVDGSINFHLKSLRLYIEALLTKELPDPEEYYKKADELLKKLSQIEFSDELKQRLFIYYEMSGQLSKAEDILFEWVDADTEGAHEKALSFYKRLQGKSDEELLKGNLNREEIEEGLEEVKSRF